MDGWVWSHHFLVVKIPHIYVTAGKTLLLCVAMTHSVCTGGGLEPSMTLDVPPCILRHIIRHRHKILRVSFDLSGFSLRSTLPAQYVFWAFCASSGRPQSDGAKVVSALCLRLIKQKKAFLSSNTSGLSGPLISRGDRNTSSL